MRPPLATAAAFAVAALFALPASQAAAQQASAAPAPDTYAIPPETAAHIRRAVESPARSAEHRARDVHRKPAEILTLAGIREGDHVVEFASIGLYFSTLLSEAVGPNGRLDMYDMPYTERFGGEAGRAFDAAHANASYHQADYNELELPAGVDAVFNVLYYHDLRPLEIDTAAFNRRVYDALEPGGVYLVIDHKAEDGSGWRDAATIHRMGVDVIVEEVTAAGFVLETDSDLLSNPADDRTQNVFSPGTRGQTDQAVFVFRKPQ